MNKCFLIGDLIKIEKFKFIINEKIKYKSQISMKLKTLDKNIIELIAYDEVADYILRNKFEKNLIFISGEIQLIIFII